MSEKNRGSMMSQDNGKKILNIGPMGFRNAPDKTGGIVVLFQEWLKYCDGIGGEHTTIDSNKSNYANRLVAVCSILWHTARKMGRYDTVMLHGTINDYLFLAPLVTWLAKRKGKRVVLRKFAGNFAKYYEKTHFVGRKLLHYALKNADVLCWETKELVAFGKEINANSHWFPNVREDSGARRAGSPYRRKLIFLSRIEKMKGIFTLMEAMKMLGDAYQLKIYGPLNGVTVEELHGENYSYHGSVEAADVPRTIAENDLLILPTHWKTEGYPGVVIEAYGVGVPVITTPMGAIPEIVSEGKTGYFAPKGDARALAECIRRIDEESYPELSANARLAFDDFDARQVNPRIYRLL